MAEERSNFVQTLITAGISMVVGVIGWGFVKNWLAEKKSKPADTGASTTSQGGASPASIPADVFTDNMKILDAKALAQDATKIPSVAARAQIQLLLQEAEKREPRTDKLGVLHEFALGDVLEQVRVGGDRKRYTFLNLATVKQVDAISQTQENARQYFPDMGAEEYKALRALVETAKQTNNPNKPLPYDPLVAQLKNIKEARAKDLEQQQVEERKQQTMRDLFPNPASSAAALAHLEADHVTGVGSPLVVASSGNLGQTGRTPSTVK